MSKADFIKMFGSELLELVLKKKKSKRKKRKLIKKMNNKKKNDTSLFPKPSNIPVGQPYSGSGSGSGSIINNIPQSKNPVQIVDANKDNKQDDKFEKYKDFLEFGNNYFIKNMNRNFKSYDESKSQSNPLNDSGSNYLTPYVEESVNEDDNYGVITNGTSSDQFVADNDNENIGIYLDNSNGKITNSNVYVSGDSINKGLHTIDCISNEINNCFFEISDSL